VEQNKTVTAHKQKENHEGAARVKNYVFESYIYVFIMPLLSA
jgi:hypothetical protein